MFYPSADDPLNLIDETAVSRQLATTHSLTD
jgi:hypothetical protein